MNIKDLIKNNTVYFSFLRGDCMYYDIFFDNEKYQFEVPLNEIGDGIMLKEDKAIYYMKWIRKALQSETLYKVK